MAGEIVSIWNIELDDQAEGASMDAATAAFPSHLSHGPVAVDEEEEEEETQFMTVAPGVWAPQISASSNKLTWRGKEQVLFFSQARGLLTLLNSRLFSHQKRLNADSERAVI
jgi:hypothetical protein